MKTRKSRKDRCLFRVFRVFVSPSSAFSLKAPPLLWMAVIYWFSTDTFSGHETGGALASLLGAIGLNLSETTLSSLHFLIRKLAHFSAYAVLALLWWRAFRGDRTDCWKWSWAAGAFVISAVYALIDEYHQSLTLTRTPSIGDSLIDMAGSLAAMAGVWISVRLRLRRVRYRVPARER